MLTARNIHFALLGIILGATSGYIFAFYQVQSSMPRALPSAQNTPQGHPEVNNDQLLAMFKEALELTGLILTKLDGTAKGGVVLGVCDELKVPVRYIGLGERAEDLREFVAADFVEALFGKDEDEAAAA